MHASKLLLVNSASLRFLPFIVTIAFAFLMLGCSDEPMTPAGGDDAASKAMTGPAGPLMARVNITFTELNSSKVFDDFIITNASDPGVRITAVHLYFYTSPTDVIIDMLPGAPGVGEGSWMYTLDESQCGLKEWRGLLEGGKRILLKWWFFTPGKSFKFGIDMDRQFLAEGRWQEEVTGADVAGTTMMVELVAPNGVQTTITKQLERLDVLQAGMTVEMPLPL